MVPVNFGEGPVLSIFSLQERVQRRAASYPANRFAAARLDLECSSGATRLNFGEQDAAYVFVPPLSTVVALGPEVPVSR